MTPAAARGAGPADAPPAPRLSVVITTRNRKAEALRAVESCLAQRVAPLEVLVFDDASEDGTADAVARAFPEAAVQRSESRVERLVLRNRAAEAARGEFIATLDDDCYLAHPGTLAEAVALLDSDPSIGVVGLALVEPYRSRPAAWRPMAAARGAPIASFLGGANVMRRRAYREAGGYRESLVHHSEEKDLSLRLLDAGWRFVYNGGSPVIHTYSGERDRSEALRDGIRNALLVGFLDFPMPFAVLSLFVTAFRVVVYRFEWKTAGDKLAGVAAGFAASWRLRKSRTPVSRATFRLYRGLPLHGAEAWAGGEAPPPLARPGPAAAPADGPAPLPLRPA